METQKIENEFVGIQLGTTNIVIWIKGDKKGDNPKSIFSFEVEKVAHLINELLCEKDSNK